MFWLKADDTTKSFTPHLTSLCLQFPITALYSPSRYNAHSPHLIHAHHAYHSRTKIMNVKTAINVLVIVKELRQVHNISTEAPLIMNDLLELWDQSRVQRRMIEFRKKKTNIFAACYNLVPKWLKNNNTLLHDQMAASNLVNTPRWRTGLSRHAIDSSTQYSSLKLKAATPSEECFIYFQTM